MTFTITGGVCTLAKEPSDKRFTSDSDVFFRLRNLMRGTGLDVVKRNMEQDRHMMGDKYTFYVRARNHSYCVYDDLYAIRSVAKDLNQAGEVTLTYHRFETEKPNVETTYSLPEIDEVMVIHNGRTVIDVYCYSDSWLLGDNSKMDGMEVGLTWKQGKNPLFFHASDPIKAYRQIKRHGYIASRR